MKAIIEAAFSRTRTVLLLLVVLLAAGTASYVAIPKKSSPDIPIPTAYVSVVYEGISPEDAGRLLIQPLETELSSIAGVDEMTATAAEGYAAVTLEFDPGFDSDEALDEVRQAVDDARPELPSGAEEPVVTEVNTSLFPILTVMLSGPVPERTLVSLANGLQDDLEGVPGVLEVEIGGDRDEMLEVLIDPTALESYGISYEALLNQVQRNNRLVAAGSIDTGAGRLTLKVPGVIETLEDVRNLPVKVTDQAVVTLGDVALIRRTFEDPTGFARIAGQPAVSLEVKKRVGANIIETVDAVRALVAERRAEWPDTVQVDFLQDESEQVETMLGDLQNNVISAILLVMVVIVATLGWRSSLLVGIAIPGSFLAGVAVLFAMGYTLNIVVLFSLILVVGMLVDGAIVIAEYADRRLAEGASPREAYADAATRMAWPVIASTLTTLAVFAPLLFWTGVVGEFMKFLPTTVIFTLTASLFMALIFVPVLGGVLARRDPQTPEALEARREAEAGDPKRLPGGTGAYARLLARVIARPALTLIVSFGALAASYVAYFQYGRGVEFFPSIEPEVAQVQIKSRETLSIWEKDRLVRAVEDRIVGAPGIEHIYSRTFGNTQGASGLSEDVIGVIQLDFEDWDLRAPAAEILTDIRARTADVPGLALQVREQEGGPASGKPVQVELTSSDADALQAASRTVRDAMQRLGGFVDVEDTGPIPGVEWRLEVDRERAARYGADVTLLGQAVQMTTAGLAIADYRPDFADDEVDIRVRFPAEERTLERVGRLRVPTDDGLVPIANFVDLVPAAKTGLIKRIDGRRAVTVSADVAEGLLPSDKTAELRGALEAADLDGVDYGFAGESEDQQEAGAFLGAAFLAALFMMLIALVTQFNSFYQAGLVMSAIVFSTAGVFLFLLVTGRPFGVVMGGIGLIALAGIVVNNNIVLIDTYNELRAEGRGAADAALRAGAQRLRPVLLTSVTTVLGLIPMVLGMNIDLINRDVAFGAPSTQYWTELSSAIAGGLTFATLLTLLLTPCLLVLGARVGDRLSRRRKAQPA